MSTVKLGNKLVGDDNPCYIIAEIGVNHNGDMDIAKQLIHVAATAGCDAVKFQKRTPELCVPLAQRSVMRETPWGLMSYMDYRDRVEFGMDEYTEIDKYCREQGIAWLASCWDNPSVDFIEQFDVPCYKIASATLIASTGMSDLSDVEKAVEILGLEDLILLHTVSTYPAEYSELNLRAIYTLRDRFKVPIGYSGHETGIASSVVTVAMGACIVERHITLNRAMWGSDQAASLEPNGITRLVRDIRLVETSMGSGVKEVVEREQPIIARLRRK